MGNCKSSQTLTISTEISPTKSSNALATPATIVSSPYPSPRPRNDVATFAIMRNGYHVFRGCLDLVSQYLKENNLAKAADAYNRFVRWSLIYKRLEEGKSDGKSPRGMFSILDEYFDGVIEKNHLRQDDIDLVNAQNNLEDATETGDVEKIKEAFTQFHLIYEKHLLEKEAITMSRVVEMKMSHINMKQLMVEEILSNIVDEEDDFKFFVQHANYILDDQFEYGASRVLSFNHALWGCATPVQWKRWIKWIKQSLSDETFEKFMDSIRL